MLKFLTHKLKTHSLNEDHLNQYKTDDHDSGTESDDENGEHEESESMMESEADGSSGSTEPLHSTGTICSAASSPLASDYDHHSSEEELEVINRSSKSVANKIVDQLPPCRQYTASGVATGPTAAPEKRKWSQVTSGGGGDPVAVVAASGVIPGDHSSGSSDEEVQGLLATMTTPVQFRSSPPSSVHKPGHRSLPPPPKLFHYGSGETSSTTLAISPRKRHRHTPRNTHVQRPCLDFEKMQQLKARAVTAWRHGGDHGAELSVFCW